MRALTIVLALVAMPLVAGLAQQDPDPTHPTHPPTPGCEADTNVKCNDDVPPPPACGPTISSPTASVSGAVFTVAGTTLSGVCIQVLLNGALVAGSTTTSAGSFSIGLAPPSTGVTYLVCAVAPTGMVQTFPTVAQGFLACPSGAGGYSAPLTPGGSDMLLNFTMQ
jgi:hypothetical protein